MMTEGAKLSKRLVPLAEFCLENRIPLSTARWWIFRGCPFAKCVVRLGRKVFVDMDKADAWADEGQSRLTSARRE